MEGEGMEKKQDKREVAVPGASYPNSDLCPFLPGPSLGFCLPPGGPQVSWDLCPSGANGRSQETNAKTKKKGTECTGRIWAEYRARS